MVLLCTVCFYVWYGGITVHMEGSEGNPDMHSRDQTQVVRLARQMTSGSSCASEAGLNMTLICIVLC